MTIKEHIDALPDDDLAKPCWVEALEKHGEAAFFVTHDGFYPLLLKKVTMDASQCTMESYVVSDERIYEDTVTTEIGTNDPDFPDLLRALAAWMELSA